MLQGFERNDKIYRIVRHIVEHLGQRAAAKTDPFAPIVTRREIYRPIAQVDTGHLSRRRQVCQYMTAIAKPTGSVEHDVVGPY